MTTDAPQAETTPNRRLILESRITRGTSSEKENYSRCADKAEAESKTMEKLRTGTMTRLKTCGAMERPKQRAKNWKTLPNAMNRRIIRNTDASEKAETLPSG